MSETYTAEQRAEGLTKARLRCNLDRAPEDRFADDDSYAAWVCEMAGLEALPGTALDSYVEQHAETTVAELEAAIAAKDAG